MVLNIRVSFISCKHVYTKAIIYDIFVFPDAMLCDKINFNHFFLSSSGSLSNGLDAERWVWFVMKQIDIYTSFLKKKKKKPLQTTKPFA